MFKFWKSLQMKQWSQYMYIKWLKAELYVKIVSVKLLVIVMIDFKHFPSTDCLMQGWCVICSDYKIGNIFTSKLESQPLNTNVQEIYRILHLSLTINFYRTSWVIVNNLVSGEFNIMFPERVS